MINFTLVARHVAEWGLYWQRCARIDPAAAAACHHNEVFHALHIMALEAIA
jgi:hypothetical protein